LKLIEVIIANKVIRNAAWIIIEQIFRMLLTVVVGILSARYLGPDNYGALSYTASFVTFFSAFASLGMDGVVLKKMIDTPNREGEYLGSCIVFRMISSLFSSIAIFGLVIFMNPEDKLRIYLALIQSFQLVLQASHLFNAWFQRYFKSKHVSIAKMLASILVSAYRIILLITSKSIYWFAFSGLLTQAVIGIVLYISYRSEKGQKISFKYNTGKEVLFDSYHFILSGLMVVIYSQIDKMMIGKMMTNTDVGYYTTALSICGMWTFIPLAILNSFRPLIMELKGSGNESRYQLRLEQVYSLIIWLSIFASIIIFLFSSFIVKTLYGNAFLGAVSVLKIAIWFETFSMIGSARGIWILCENKNKYVKYYLGLGAVVNVILNAFLIPSFGIEGAAMATLVTQIFTSLLSPLFFKETRQHTIIVLRAVTFNWLKKLSLENKNDY
jgi:O-antigen/teichoic acid export membrane protein